MVAKRCYYEVLGLQRGCDDNAIKVAYRKLALKYHPDKNPSKEATALFQEIQEANSVLSDPQERAWYDSHRDEILRGGDGEGDSDDDDAYVVNVWPYFSGGVFSGYGDDEYGFYSVFRELFERIDVREREGALKPSENAEHAPTFGDSTSAWPVVSAFYAHWGDFVSKLSFGWADEYREHDAPSRQVRRAMEKENRKARDSAKRKYQDTIRALVDHIKKRDKRVILRQVEVRKEEAEKVRLREEAAKKKAEEYKKQRAEWLQQQRHEWEEEEARRLVEAEDGAGGEAAYRLADESGDSEDEDEWRGSRKKGNSGGVRRRFRDNKDVVLYDCAVCDKSFKSEKQLQNHQKSKTHRKMVESLREEYGDELLDDLETFKEIAEQGADDVVNSSTAPDGDDGDKGDAVAAGDAHSCNGVPEQAVLSAEGNDDGDDDGVYRRDSATGGVKEGPTAEDSDSDEDDVERMSHFASAFRRGIDLSDSDSDG